MSAHFAAHFPRLSVSEVFQFAIQDYAKSGNIKSQPEGHLSIDSGLNLRAERGGVGHFNEAHAESLPLEDSPSKGITVQRGFYIDGV